MAFPKQNCRGHLDDRVDELELTATEPWRLQ
jgi:hypothetical protein